MKRTLQTLLSLVVVAASLVSCAKETFKENVIPAGEKIQVTVGGSIGEFAPSDATKANAGSVVKVTWEATDVVYVYDGSACLDSLKVTPNEDNPSNALLSGTITASDVSPSKLSLVYVKGATKAPDINDGKISVDISSQSAEAVADVPFVLYATIDYDVEKLTKKNEFVPFYFATSVMTVNCTGLPTGEGNSKINITKSEIEGVSTACELTIDGTGVTVSGASTGTITRTAGFEQADSRGSFKIALAADPAAPAARNILVFQENKAYGAPFTSKTLAGGKSYNTVYQMNEYIPIVLAGEFTVADDGNGNVKKVHFSKGNLQATYTGSKYTWGFAAHQYNYIGNAIGNTSIDNQQNGDVVDLFGWSTSSTNYGISASVDNADYFGDFEDWGKALGDDKTWHTLSQEEWEYLFGKEDKFKWASVNGVAGCVIAPDNFDGELAESYANDAELAEYNLVFLPAAGGRDGSEVYEVQEYGYYWSSTLDEYDTDNAISLSFGDDYSDAWFSACRFSGKSVRLVTESSTGGYVPAVKETVVRVTDVTLNKSKTFRYQGEKETLYATIAPANALNKQITWLSSDTDVATVDEGGTVTSKAEGSAVITATTVDGNFTAVCLITVIPKPIPADPLPGVFTVADYGAGKVKKVQFSKGNLQATYNSKTRTYSLDFAANQYDYIGNAAGNTTIGSPTDGAVVDLFGISTKRTNYGISTSTSTSYYSGDFVDWGNALDDKGTWTTLSGKTDGEWNYLLNSRDGNRFAKAKVHNMNGLLIFPDGYTLPSGYSSEGGTGMCKVNDNGEADFPSNNIPDETWSEMEATGVVFLPTAGYRQGSEVKETGIFGDYWSSSTYNGSGYAFRLVISSNGVTVNDTPINASNGHSVRLVTEAK